MKSTLKNYRQSPRKVRLLADLVKGKTVSAAVALIDFSKKRAGVAVKKVILSAAANAKNSHKADESNLIIKDLRIDKGVTLKRRMPRARGSAFPINKRSSHITVELEEKK